MWAGLAQIFRLRHPQHVIAAIDANNLARGAGPGLGGEVDGSAAYRLKRGVAAQGRVLVGVFDRSCARRRWLRLQGFSSGRG